jgi:7,8-dihydropterin-6-yl-methyl-4-(beta-D-ribofuranosyl)aminobenzene 5'-phosphate synthase
VKIYAPKENFGVYGASLPSKFYRKDETLPPFMRYYDGAPPETMVFGSAWPRANFELIDQTKEIAPGIHLIAGGFHLVAAPVEVIAQSVTLLHDTAKVDYIAPGHCTVEPTFAALMRAFGDRYLYAGLGTVIALGAQPHAVARAGALPRASGLPDR